MPDGEITLVLQRIEQGDPHAAEQLLPLVYAELRRLAAEKISAASSDHTLQPTALVHEAWLRVGGDEQPQWGNRARFLAAAADAMRRILVDHAREREALRESGTVATPGPDDEELLVVNEAIDALDAHDPRLAGLVKQKFFAGLTLEETAAVLGGDVRTLQRDWAYARGWLFNEVKRRRG